MWLLFHFKEFFCKNYNISQLKNELGVDYKKANENWLNKSINEKNIDIAVKNSNKNNEFVKKECMEKYYYSGSDFQNMVEFLKINK